MLTNPLHFGMSLSTAALTFSLGRWPLPARAFLPRRQFQLFRDMLTKGTLSLSSLGMLFFLLHLGDSCCSHRMCPHVARLGGLPTRELWTFPMPHPPSSQHCWILISETQVNNWTSPPLKVSSPWETLMCFLTWILPAPWSSGPGIRHCSLHRGYRQKFSCSLKASILRRAGTGNKWMYP